MQHASNTSPSTNPRPLFWGFFVATLFIQCIGSIFYFGVSNESETARIIFAFTKIVMLAAPIALFFLGTGLKPTAWNLHARDIGMGLGAGLVASALIFVVWNMFGNSMPILVEVVGEKAATLGLARNYFAIAIVFSITHSLFEEYFWRWYAVGGLELKLPWTRAALLGNGAFTLHHIVILSLFFNTTLTILFSASIWMMGVIWSLLYKKTGTLWAGWISHALIDVALFTVGYLIIS